METNLERRVEELEQQLAMAVNLLTLCDKVLGRHWFEGTHNNEDVIAANEQIKDFLAQRS